MIDRLCILFINKLGANQMHIILFDGDCNFCNHNVLFIIERDKQSLFKFASLNSPVGKDFIHKFNISRANNSLIFIENNHYYTKSTAALKISRHLKLFWNLFYLFIFIPRPIRDALYNIIANNRYKFLKNNVECIIPPEHIRQRFLS